MADSLTDRCSMTQTLRGTGASRDRYSCAKRAEFYVHQGSHPSVGRLACAQHTLKAIRAVLVDSDGLPVKVVPIRADQAARDAEAADDAMSASERFEHDQADEARLDARYAESGS